MSSTLAAGRKRPRVFYGWWVVAAGFLALTVESGVDFYGFGIFLKVFETEFNWSRAEISAAMSLYFLTQGVLSPIVGRLVQKFGSRRVMVVGTVLLGSAYLLLNHLETRWELYAAYVLVGAGASSLTFVPIGTAIANWFSRRRGTMIGITYTGLGVGGMAGPPLLTYLNSHLGWRTSYFIVAMVMFLVVLPVVALVIRTRPEEKGLLPDGDELPDGVVSGEKGSLPLGVSVAPTYAVAKLVTMPLFWLVGGGLLLTSLGTLAIATHQYAFLTDLGWSAETAAFALSVTGFFSVAAKLFFGSLSDRISPCYSAIICFGLQAIGLILVLTVRLDALVWLYVVVISFGMAGVPLLRPLVVVEAFGIKSFGTVLGLTTGVSSIGSVLGPLFAGYVFDVMGRYDAAFTIFTITFVFAIIAFWTVKRQLRGKATPSPALAGHS